MVKALVTNEVAIQSLEELAEPDLTWDDAAETADGQASHSVDVWFIGTSAFARDANSYGQRVWYNFSSVDEARTWFDAVIG